MTDASVPPLTPESVAAGREAANAMVRPTSPDPQAHGALNPLAASDAAHAWELLPDALWLWRTRDGDVVIQGPDGDVTIPASRLPIVARSLLAVHVQNGRPDIKART